MYASAAYIRVRPVPATWLHFPIKEVGSTATSEHLQEHTLWREAGVTDLFTFGSNSLCFVLLVINSISFFVEQQRKQPLLKPNSSNHIKAVNDEVYIKFRGARHPNDHESSSTHGIHHVFQSVHLPTSKHYGYSFTGLRLKAHRDTVRLV